MRSLQKTMFENLTFWVIKYEDIFTAISTITQKRKLPEALLIFGSQKQKLRKLFIFLTRPIFAGKKSQ